MVLGFSGTRSPTLVDAITNEGGFLVHQTPLPPKGRLLIIRQSVCKSHTHVLSWAYPRARRGFLCPVQSDGGLPQCGQARLFYQIMTMTMLPVAQHDSHMEMSPAPSEALGGYKRLGGEVSK